MTAIAAYPACAAEQAELADHPTTTTTEHHNPQAMDPTFVDWDGVARIHAHNQAAQRAARSQSRPRPTPAASIPAPRAGGDERTVSSTAYCLEGTMANGQRVYRGAVAMNGVPLGSKWQVIETGAVYTVADRIGHGSGFDIAMPGDCAAARAYGRRTITVRRVG